MVEGIELRVSLVAKCLELRNLFSCMTCLSHAYLMPPCLTCRYLSVYVSVYALPHRDVTYLSHPSSF